MSVKLVGLLLLLSGCSGEFDETYWAQHLERRCKALGGTAYHDKIEHTLTCSFQTKQVFLEKYS